MMLVSWAWNEDFMMLVSTIAGIWFHPPLVTVVMVKQSIIFIDALNHSLSATAYTSA